MGTRQHPRKPARPGQKSAGRTGLDAVRTGLRALIHGLARKRGLQDADAADLTQDVLRLACRYQGLEYDPLTGSFRGWFNDRTQPTESSSTAEAHEEGSGDTEVQNSCRNALQKRTRSPGGWRNMSGDCSRLRLSRFEAIFRMRPGKPFWQTGSMASREGSSRATGTTVVPSIRKEPSHEPTEEQIRCYKTDEVYEAVTLPHHCPEPARLKAFLEGALPEPELTDLNQHFESCGITANAGRIAVKGPRGPISASSGPKD